MGLHVRESVKGMIFILNPNPNSLSSLESWSFNTLQEVDFITIKIKFLLHI